MRFRWFFLFLPVAVLIMQGAPGTGWAAAAYVLLLVVWLLALEGRRQRKAARRR